MEFLVELAQPDVVASTPLEAARKVRDMVRDDAVDGFVVTATSGDVEGRVWTVRLADELVIDGGPDADPDSFTVLGTYDDGDGDVSRFAHVVQATSPEDAEAQVEEDSDVPVTIAAVVRGRCDVVA